MNDDGESWEGIPCILRDWIYTADPALFEARWAVKRRNANYFADVVGIGASESESAEILKMVRAARDTVNAAKKVERELVIEARARGIRLREIGDALDIDAPAVSNIISRGALTPERRKEITRELHAWAALTHLWNREVETDEPGESFYLHGIDQLLLAHRRFELAIEPSDPFAAGQKMASARKTLHTALLSLTEPVIPHTIAKYAPKRDLNDDASSNVIPDVATAYIRHGIFEVVLANLALNDCLENSSSADLLLAVTYLMGALTSLRRPEAMFVFDEMIEFLRREHPALLSSTHFSAEEIIRQYKRRFETD
jgi:hypothetical protein